MYDATNRMVEGTNWKGDKSAYTCNGLGLRVNNLVTTHAGQTYDRDYVIDYTSPENDDLYVYAMGNGQLEYEQRHVYAGSERIEQITEKGNGGWERTLYVHEDVMGNTRYYTKSNGQTFAELQYDAWGQAVSPNKLVNNDHGNYVFATFTGHIYDPVLDIYFAEARFYDAINRTWMAMDPIKDGLNWYQYVAGNPIKYVDISGKYYITIQQIGNSTYQVDVQQENGVFLGIMGAADELLPVSVLRVVYDQYRESQGAYVGSTYEPGTVGESLLESIAGRYESELQDEILNAMQDSGRKAILSKVFGIYTAAKTIDSYATEVDSVRNEDILFELVEGSNIETTQILIDASYQDAQAYADSINEQLEKGLEFIDVNNEFSAYDNVAEHRERKVIGCSMLHAA